jgi:hypothetical protein
MSAMYQFGETHIRLSSVVAVGRPHVADDQTGHVVPVYLAGLPEPFSYGFSSRGSAEIGYNNLLKALDSAAQPATVIDGGGA